MSGSVSVSVSVLVSMLMSSQCLCGSSAIDPIRYIVLRQTYRSCYKLDQDAGPEETQAAEGTITDRGAGAWVVPPPRSMRAAHTVAAVVAAFMHASMTVAAAGVVAAVAGSTTNDGLARP